jgi:DNA-directed RNA polymerase subunit omega
MARVTIEDCIEKIPSRFELVVLAAQRAKEISSGAKSLIDKDNDKDAVVALREIAAGKLSPESLREGAVKKYQNRQMLEEDDKPEEDSMEIHAEMANFTFNKADVQGMSYENEDMDDE